MKSLKTLAMVAVLGLGLAMGAGCAKKNVEEVAAPAAPAVSTKAISKKLTKNVVLKQVGAAHGASDFLYLNGLLKTKTPGFA